MSYDHVQRSPLSLLAIALGVMFELGAWVAPSGPDVVLLIVGVIFFLVAAAFGHLRVTDRGDRLRVAYGPLPLFGREIPYASIRGVQPGRSTFVDGWGIHWLPGRGVIWNVWGRDCIELDVEGRSRLRIGTDDPDGLYRHLAARVG